MTSSLSLKSSDMLCAYLFCVVLANFFSFQNGTTEDVTSEEEEEEEMAEVGILCKSSIS